LPTPTVHPGSSRVELEATAVKIDGGPKVFSVSVATDTPLDRHDLAIDSFGDSVRVAVSGVAHHVGQSVLDGPGDILQRHETGANHSLVPGLDVRDRSGFVGARQGSRSISLLA
jgi:hypothetical protein